MFPTGPILHRFHPYAIGILASLALALSGCGGTDLASEPPTVRFVSPTMNATVGTSVFVKLATTHFKFSGAKGMAAAGDVVGHLHLFLDQPIGLDIDAVEQLSLSDTVTLDSLSVGKHYLLVEGANADHQDIETMVDSVAFTVAVP
jgi:hypothetical protein